MPYNNNNYARYKETKNDIDLASNDVIIRKWNNRYLSLIFWNYISFFLLLIKSNLILRKLSL